MIFVFQNLCGGKGTTFLRHMQDFLKKIKKVTRYYVVPDGREMVTRWSRNGRGVEPTHSCDNPIPNVTLLEGVSLYFYIL